MHVNVKLFSEYWETLVERSGQKVVFNNSLPLVVYE